MEWLSTEEVLLFIATLTASGLLVVGTLRLIWPTRPRGVPPRDRVARSGAVAAPPGQPERPSTRVLPPPGDRGVLPPEDRAATALRLGRTLLDQALQDSDPRSERRRNLIYRAIACLNRGVEAAPDDEVLRVTLTSAHAALWHTYQQIGIERLAKEMPWRATSLAPPPPLPESLKADATTGP